MPCYKPLEAFKSPIYGVTFKKSEGANIPLQLACGQCVGCRLERSRSWAVRCVHEASTHEKNSLITLTYAPEHLPENGTLVKKHFQDFMKRLRKHYSPKKIRYYMCGEYGEKLGRPHYHALLFGLDFKDKYHHRTSNGNKCYRSDTLEKLWLFGLSEIGNVTFESAAYVSRYVMKKITGDQADNHYERINKETGEIVKILPEYNNMSLRPGIGKKWFDQFKTDVYPSDRVILKDGKKVKTPKYYDTLIGKKYPILLESLKEQRKNYALKNKKDSTPERLKVRENCAKARLNQLPRELS